MKHILAELNETLGARGSLIVSKDGLLIAADVRPEVHVDRLVSTEPDLAWDVAAVCGFATDFDYRSQNARLIP